MKRLALVVLMVACTKAPAVPPPAAAAAAAEAQPGPRVTLPDGYAVHVEIAADDETRSTGLMYRDQLRPASGMIFIFPRDDEYAFWMKNTLIPLDMIWIDANRKIVHVKHDVPPCKVENCPSYPPNVPSRYVLELAAGVAAQHGLKAGDVLRFEGLDNVVVK
jgi:hypothetical protein